MLCEKMAKFRYTWPGRDEAVCCEEHAAEICAVAKLLGFHLQMIQLSENDSRCGFKCTTLLNKASAIYIDSPILGRTKLPAESERRKIKEMVEDCPLGVFQELNKYFNSIGKMMNIGITETTKPPKATE